MGLIEIIYIGHLGKQINKMRGGGLNRVILLVHLHLLLPDLESSGRLYFSITPTHFVSSAFFVSYIFQFYIKLDLGFFVS